MLDGVEKVFFSTEGLFNHWWDIGEEGRSMLHFLGSRLPVKFLTCLRDPVEFAASLYVQYLRNPPVHPCYGRDLSLEEMLEVPWSEGAWIILIFCRRWRQQSVKVAITFFLNPSMSLRISFNT